MATGLLPVERAALLSAAWPVGGHLVLPSSGARHERAASADARAGDRSAFARVQAAAHPADPGGLDGRAEQGASAVQAGGPPGGYESPPNEAQHAAPGTRADRAGIGSESRYR